MPFDPIKYEKKIIALRYFLGGRKYYLATKAMEYAMVCHTGYRKDGVTPTFSHQLDITSYLRTMLDQMIHPERTLAVAFLHDTVEDVHGVSFDMLESDFGHEISGIVRILTKTYDGIDNAKLPIELYYRDTMAGCPVASLVKGADRIHNHQTMVGVFSLQKQVEYIQETQKYVLPMIKSARRLIPQQEPIYENMKNILNSQIELIQTIHDGMKNK